MLVSHNTYTLDSCWIVIYPVDNAIQRLNKWGLMVKQDKNVF